MLLYSVTNHLQKEQNDMSEYQYYEFRAIDHPLTDKQRDKVDSLSSRAYVTAYQASFVYNYGDFRGDVRQLMSDYFDIMLYMTNWGSRRLIFRIPASLIDMKQIALFCISEEIDHWTSSDKKNIFLELNFNDDEQADWADGEGWLDDLVGLREELIQGDFRVLYLAWLKAAQSVLNMGGIDDDTLEPPVPPKLQQLSSAQKAYIRFLDIDKTMLAIAAKQSKEQAPEIKVKQWVKQLAEKDKHDFLVRLSLGEKNLSPLLNKHLQALAVKKQSDQANSQSNRRTISSLIKLTEQQHQKKKKAVVKKAEVARQKKLESLDHDKEAIWNEVYQLIEEKRAKAYDQAIQLLNSFHELAEYKNEWPLFNKHIEHIKTLYSNRSALLRRMRDSKLIE